MPTPAARFLNAEKGGTAESKRQKDGKSKCQIVYRDYNRAEIWISKLQLSPGRFLRDVEIWSRNLKRVQIILGQITRCNMVSASMSLDDPHGVRKLSPS